MKNPDLKSIFRCRDQSALINNYVTSHDPTPGAWSHQSEPQSILGRVSFPLVLTINRGEVYTRIARGQIVEQMLDGHEWLPWAYDGQNEATRVERSIGPDVFHGRVTVSNGLPAMLLLECAAGGGMNPTGAGLNVACERVAWGFRFLWEDKYEIHLRLSGKGRRRVRLADDPALLRQIFAGLGSDVQLSERHLVWVWKNVKRLWIGVEFDGEVDVTFAVGRPVRVRSSGHSPARLRRKEQQRWEDFFRGQVPRIETADPIVRDAYYFAWQMIWSSRCTGGSGMTPFAFTSASRLYYGATWWWDEAFTSAMLRHLPDPMIRYEFLDNYRVAQCEDGIIVGSLNYTVDPPVTANAANATAMPMEPPVFAVVLQLLREKPGWPADLRPLYDMLHRQAQWFDLPHRDTDGDGLVEYHDCNDGGVDQSTRWDQQKVNPEMVMCALRPTEPIDFNVWTSVLWDVLGDMAEQLGDLDAASAHRDRSSRMMDLVDEFMWDDADGMYYDIDAHSHVKIKVKSPFAFMVMLSRRARKDRVERLVREHLLNPREFWCRYPLPSISLDNPAFDPADMFRGSTWVFANWLVIEGLRRQGFTQEAMQLARKTIELVGPRYERRGRRTRSPRLWEWYHPHTGEPLGNPQFSWSALVVDLILRFADSGAHPSEA